MTGDGISSGGIFLTAAQSLQSFNVDMRLREQANQESAKTGFVEQGTSTLQQAPASDGRNSANAGDSA